MTEHPVETYELAIESTKAILKFAKRTNVKGIVYISSLEQYGQILDERLVSEDIQGYIDCTDSRSSYPLGKRAAEYMCSAYAHEYGINVKIARLTQTFGAGVAADDNRVFAQFARSIINGKDIVLHTTGESAKPYCYTTDCVSAILYILLRGTNGDAYNVANESTYISIKDMAMFLRVNFNPAIHVVVEPHPEMGYAPTTKLKLSASKLAGLGWHAKYNLKDMYSRLIAYLSNHDTNS
jgi:nucleoside-diphosphate-sugar epimerase